MPYKVTPVDLSQVITASDKRPLVPNGNRITGLSVMPPAAGGAFSLSLVIGNNPPLGPITGPVDLEIDANAPASDTDEGLFAINGTAQAGVIPLVFVSYVRVNKTDANGEPTPGGIRLRQV